MQTRLITDVEAAWLAGLFEGEGTAWCRRYTPKTSGHAHTAVRVSIAMTDWDVVEHVDRLFPSPSGIKTRPNPGGVRKPLYYWNVSRRDRVAEFLRLILPYLGERRTKRALEVLALAEDPNCGTGSQHRSKTQCPRGHPYTVSNTYVATRKKDGGPNRMCRTCRREADRRRRANQRRTDVPDSAHQL